MAEELQRYTVKIDIVTDTRQMQTGIQQASTSLSNFEKTIGRIQRSLMSFFAVMLAREALQGFANMVKSAADLQLQLALVGRASGMANEQLQLLKEDLFDIAVNTGITNEQLVRLTITAGRAGAKTREEMIDIAKNAAYMGMTTDLSAEQATTALIKLANALRLSFKDIPRIATAIAFVGRETAASEQEIADALYRMAAAGKTFGLTLEQLTVMAGLTIEMGIAANRTGTDWTRAFLQIATQSEKAANAVGMSKTAFRELVKASPEEALIKIAQSISQIPDPLQRMERLTQIFGSVGARAFAPFMDILPKYIELLRKTNEIIAKGNLVEEDANKLSDQTAIKLAKARESFKELGNTIAENTLPALGKFSEGLTNIIKQLNEDLKSGNIKKPTLAGFLMGLVLKGPGGLALETTTNYIRKIKELQNSIQEGKATGRIPTMKAGFEEQQINLFLPPEEVLSDKIKSIEQLLYGIPVTTSTITEQTKQIWSDVTLSIQSVWDALRTAIDDDMAKIGAASDNVAKSIIQAFQQTGQVVFSSFGTFMTQIVIQGKSAGEAFMDMWQTVASTVIDLISQMIAKLAVFLAMMAASKLPGLGFLAPLARLFTGFQHGGIVKGVGVGDRVPALLEPGEMVIPKEQVNRTMNYNNPVNVNISMAGAYIMDDPNTVQRLYREYLKDIIRNDIKSGRDKFYS